MKCGAPRVKSSAGTAVAFVRTLQNRVRFKRAIEKKTQRRVQLTRYLVDVTSEKKYWSVFTELGYIEGGAAGVRLGLSPP